MINIFSGSGFYIEESLTNYFVSLIMMMNVIVFTAYLK